MDEHSTYVALGYSDDFGLTGLAELIHARGRRIDRMSALALAAESADGSEGEEAVELGEDARRLLSSPVSDEVLRTVWLASVGACFDPAAHGMAARAWLTELSEVATARLRRNKRSYVPPEIRPVRDAGLGRLVVAEIRDLGAVLDRAQGAPGLAAGLEEVVDRADVDLGYRLFLRALKVSRPRIGKERYDRLLALAGPLGHPLAVVHDGLDVCWPPVDTRRRDMERDFGLSGLAERFAGSWHPHTAREILTDHLSWDGFERTPGTEAALLLEDVLRVLRSGLATDTLTTLWLAASEQGSGIHLFGGDGRRWLEEVVAVCEERLRAVAPGYVPVLRPVDAGAAAGVLRQLREREEDMAGRVVGYGGEALPGSVVAAALRRVVTRVDPDLGFRLFLRALAALAVPLTREQFAGYEAIGERFRYGESHFLRIEQLVRIG
ncbi:hypothetical protein [Streptomyces sp. SUK 48]|uniref:hypothetical protein n=1 Tax=unclassified Streptomyces TaxID=2593676 RepID=UPI00129A1980|nr:hypothetical protein [Streptomyces sp. SUK 48]